MNFQDFNFDTNLNEGMLTMGYKNPTPIQQQAIPTILKGSDLIACAQTGTGKTAAYLLPVMNKIIHTEIRHLNTLIIAPTRELAVQIDQQVEALGYFTNVSSLAVYGGGSGSDWDQQKKALRLGADIIIATPGRLISMLASGEMKFEHLQHLILDEADRMLDMGFYDDIIRIINYLPTERQTLLFSATMPARIRTLAGRILRNPEQINIAISKPAEGILQQAYLVFDLQKVGLIKHILKQGNFKSVIIFCSTKEKVKILDRELQRTGMSIEAFHSDLEQKEREAIMLRFKNKSLKILVGTDILSRGLDVDGVDLVVNYDVPPDPEDYIHRIGRTARAESTGTAITFIAEKGQQRFHSIETLIEREIPKLPLPEFLGEGPAYQPLAKVNRGGGFNRNKKRKSFKPKSGHAKQRVKPSQE